MKHALYVFSLVCVFIFSVPPVASAYYYDYSPQVVTTPYWCGSYWSSYPCMGQYTPAPYYSQNYYGQYLYQQYSYPQTYPYYYYPCVYYCGQQATITNVTGPQSLMLGLLSSWDVTINGGAGQYVTMKIWWGDASSSQGPYTRQIYVSGTQTFGFAHAYALPGTYNVAITLTDSTGHESTVTRTVYVH